LAVGNIIAPLLGGALVDGLGGTDIDPVTKVIAPGFNKAANVMSSVLMLNFIVYSIIQFCVLSDPNKNSDKEGESTSAVTS